MKHLKFAALALLALSPIAHAKNIILCFEAENAAKIARPMKKVKAKHSTMFSGKGYVEIPFAAWQKGGSATYKLNVTTPGNYYFFARTMWTDQFRNSILLVVNGTELMLGEDGLYEKWHWVGSRILVHLKAGANTIVLKNREPGVKIDQIFLCTDREYEPAKPRPITHDGGTGKQIK